jgi:eukaryotic-like serine/threonine-protein kinase
MALTAGSRLGPYEILTPIGAGGMGEVYRARDKKLDRDVAIKILPEALAADPDRIVRFEREAKTLAALNHPNIAHIYGLEESEGVSALVMELVEGPTLADRIARGPVPLDEALPIARQIAEGLEAAHEQGIIHRDLKPANLKMRDDGTVKILDFGLAKALDPIATSNAQVTNSPTLSLHATMAGMILGTAAYMSPEQARGKAVDRRADIWAFGAVLYEMLAGRRAFDGDDASITLAAVMMKDPDWAELPPSLPSRLRELLRRCLERDPKRRLQAIAEARIQIETILSGSDLSVASDFGIATTQSGRGKASSATWIAAAGSTVVLLMTTLTLAGALYLRRSSSGTPVVRFGVSPPAGWTITIDGRFTGGSGTGPNPVAVSPDGRRLALVANSPTGRSRLWLRSLDTLVAQELPDTDGATSPFWSPNSQSVAFFADGKLKRINLSGGPPLTLCNLPAFNGATWNRTGTILLAVGTNGTIQRLSDAGGTPSVIWPDHTDPLVRRPSFLPDGQHFLYFETGGVYAGSVDSAERKLIIKDPDANTALYSDGYLLFLRGTTLTAQRFDPRRLEFSGEPVPIAEHVQTSLGTGPRAAYFSVSDNGVLAYQPATEIPEISHLAWVDRTGKTLAELSDPAAYSDLELSPDGTRLAVSVRDPALKTSDIWIVEAVRGVRTRVTSHPANEWVPIWSPDGSRIVFESNRNEAGGLYVTAANGLGAEEVLLQGALTRSFSWSRDGRYVLYQLSSGRGGRGSASDLWVLPLAGERKAFPFLQSPFGKQNARVSPDGRWVAYASDETGVPEVYVASFPRPDSKVRISAAGGGFPRWRSDGRELFYWSQDRTAGPLGASALAPGQVMAVPVDGQGEKFNVETANRLFELRRANFALRYNYDISADGQRFIVNMVSEQQAPLEPITVVLNWTGALKP